MPTPSGDAINATLFRINVPVLPLDVASPGLVINYQATLRDSIQPGSAPVLQIVSCQYFSSPSLPHSLSRAFNLNGTWSVAVPMPQMSVTILSTSSNVTAGNNLTIGEAVTYAVRVTLPQGLSSNVTLTPMDFDFGLSFNLLVNQPNLTLVTSDSNIQCGWPSGSTTTVPCEGLDLLSTRPLLVGNWEANATDARSVSLLLGDVWNFNRHDNQTDWIEFLIKGRLLNLINNTRNKILHDYAGWSTHPYPSLNPSSQLLQLYEQAPDLVVQLAFLTVNHSLSSTVLSSGRILEVTVTIYHTKESQIDGFSVSLMELLPPGLVYLSGSLRYERGLMPTTIAGQPVPLNWSDAASPNTRGFQNTSAVPVIGFDSFPLKSVSVLRYSTTDIDPSSSKLEIISQLAWASLPGVAPGKAEWQSLQSVNVTYVSSAGWDVCYGGVAVALGGLVTGFRGGVYANDGYVRSVRSNTFAHGLCSSLLSSCYSTTCNGLHSRGLWALTGTARMAKIIWASPVASVGPWFMFLCPGIWRAST